MRTLIALALVLAAAVAVAGGAARTQLAGRIVFASERGSTLENSRLYSVRVDGSRRRALSRNPNGGDGGARWSPDGAQIAFWSERSSCGRLIQSLYVMRPDGRGQRRVTPKALRVPRDSDGPRWSPDGASLAFGAARGSRFGIWTVRADGSRLRFLALGGLDVAWSPRGDQIAFATGHGISVVPALGGTVRRLTRGPNDSSPAWSPDGRTIAFVRSDANGQVQALDIIAASGGPIRRIFGGTRGVTMGRSPQWSPSGRLLAFEAKSGVFVVRVRDRAVSRLRKRGDWPAWSPDGRRIAFTWGSVVYVMNADGSRVQRVSNERGAEFDDGPVWSPDGRTLVYATSLLKSDFEVFSVRADGSDLRQLTRNSVQDWMPAWSPSRRRIAFVRRGSIWLMRADGMRTRRLFAGRQPSWSPDGSQLAYSAGGGVSIRRIDGGGAIRLVDGSSPAWSPSGAEIAFVRGTRLMAIGLAGRVERTVIDVSSRCQGGEETVLEVPDWSPDGRRLAYAVVCDDGRFSIATAEIVNADGSGLRELRIDNLVGSRLAWSTDGMRVAFVTEVTRRIGTVRVDGSGGTAVIRDVGGAAYLDLDW